MTETTMNPARGQTPGEDAGWQALLRSPLVLALAIALAVQLLLALLLGGDGRMAPAARDQALLELDFEGIGTIEIAGADGEPLLLKRSGDNWVLPALGDFPAGASRIDTLLDDLEAIKRPLPVATSADARRRFKVADDAFERRLTLSSDGNEATLIVGDSPGFRRLFARLDGEDAIYDLRLALFDLSAEADDWIDRGQLQFDRGEIEQITVSGGEEDDWTLVRGKESWSLQGSEEPVEQAQADALADAVATIGYTAVFPPDADADYDLDTPARQLGITHDGNTRRYLLAPIGDTGDYALRQDGAAYVYRIGAFEAETLVDTNRAKLLGQEEPTAADGQPATDEAAADTDAPAEQAPPPAEGTQPAGAATPEPTPTDAPAEPAQ